MLFLLLPVCLLLLDKQGKLLILVNACRIAVLKDSRAGNLFQKNLLDRTDKKDPLYSYCLLNYHNIRTSQYLRDHYHNSVYYLEGSFHT